MEVFRRDEIPVTPMGDSGEYREYYQSNQNSFRIVVTTIPPGGVQSEHRHVRLLDTTYVLEGELHATERRDGVLHETTLRKGDLICFAPPFYHNFVNRGSVPVRILTVKTAMDPDMSPDEFEALCESDWFGYENPEALVE